MFPYVTITCNIQITVPAIAVTSDIYHFFLWSDKSRGKEETQTQRKTRRKRHWVGQARLMPVAPALLLQVSMIVSLQSLAFDFFQNDFFFKFQSQLQRERHTQTQRSSIHRFTLPRWLPWQTLGLTETSSQELHSGLTRERQGAKNLGHLPLPPKYISRKPSQKWSSWDSNRPSKWDASIPSGSLVYCTTM